MQQEEIESIVRTIIANIADKSPDDIDLSQKLTSYMRKSSKRILAARLDATFTNLNGTILFNDLFRGIKRGNHIVEFVLEYYR